MASDAQKLADMAQENDLLRARLRVLEDALQNMPPGLCMFDAERRLAVCNERFSETLGFPPGAIRVGMTSLEMAKAGMDVGDYPEGMTAEDLEALLWPDLIIIGGGVSKKGEKFIPLLTPRCEVVAAKLQNEAGIVGAALTAA